jgi:hypothetical protein
MAKDCRCVCGESTSIPTIQKGATMSRLSDWLFRKSKENTMDDTPRVRGNALHTAKVIIRDLAREYQYVTADAVQDELVKLGYSISDLGNAAGSMFRGHQDVYKVPDATVKSKRTGRRGGRIAVYESNVYRGIVVPLAVFAKEYNG